MHEERLKYALVNKFGRTLSTIEGREGLEEAIERYNARKYDRYHVHHVVQIIEQDMPVAQITKKYFMGVDAWAREAQKSLYVKSYFEDERIRKWILKKVQGYAASGIPCSDEIKMADKAIDYLEKQKPIKE